jgi:hypothetical protein
MIAVFKTNVAKTSKAKIIVNKLQEIFPDALVNFDLQDCDRILRVESAMMEFEIHQVLGLMEQEGLFCEMLND